VITAHIQVLKINVTQQKYLKRAVYNAESLNNIKNETILWQRVKRCRKNNIMS